MRLIYFGSGEFGIPTLRALASRHEVLAIVTQPDRPAGRGRTLTPTPVAAWAAANLPAVPVLKPSRVAEPGVVAGLRAIPADAFVVIAFGQKLPPSLLESRLAINLHASLLPRWRGAAPINAAILAGDPCSGNSVITLADRMDAGQILAQSRRDIDPLMTAGELHDLLSADGPDLVLTVLDQAARGTLRPVPQDETQATRAPKLTRDDGRLEPGLNAEQCRRRIHGLTPWPGVWSLIAGRQVKLLRATVVGGAGATRNAPGDIVDAAAGHIACGEGTLLRLLEVQPAGGRAMAWGDFVRGRGVTEGTRIEGINAR